MKKFILLLVAATLLSLGAARASASDTAPVSVIHVVTVAWKADAKPEQIQAALDGVKALPAAFPGITHVWVKSIKVQNPEGTVKKRTHVFVMEFKDEQALKDYSGSAAQKEWYKVYQPVRDESTTHDITN
ncbi:MAG: Dabb family protein [Lacunisphaera sp.]